MSNPAEGFLGALLILSFISCMYVCSRGIIGHNYTPGGTTSGYMASPSFKLSSTSRRTQMTPKSSSFSYVSYNTSVINVADCQVFVGDMGAVSGRTFISTCLLIIHSLPPQLPGDIAHGLRHNCCVLLLHRELWERQGVGPPLVCVTLVLLFGKQVQH